MATKPSAAEQKATRARRRGSLNLKTILQIPAILSKSQGSQQGQLQASSNALIGAVPADILLEIADRLWPPDLFNFSLASSHTRALLLPVLYSTVVLKSSRACLLTLPMLLANPHLCKLIKKLAVRPNYYLAWPCPNGPADENWVAEMLEKIVPTLTALHTFDWDGLEMPRDGLWTSLRESCPMLTTIYSNVGLAPLSPDSSLFSFSNLTSFSLTIRNCVPGTTLFPTPEALPERLWDMLLTRCPALEELTLCSFSSSARIFDLTPLFAPLASTNAVTDATASSSSSSILPTTSSPSLTFPTFPSLTALTLGSFGYTADFTLSPTAGYPLSAFLKRHQSLKYLRLAWNFKRWMSPEVVDLGLGDSDPNHEDLERDSTGDSSPNRNTISNTKPLPELSTFIGIAQHLSSLLPSPSLSSDSAALAPPPPPSLQPHPVLAHLSTIDLTAEPLYVARIAPLTRVFAQCVELKELDLWVHVADDSGGLGGELMGAGSTVGLRGLFGACKGLEDFHFMCTSGFGNKALADLTSLLQLLPNLETFSLTKGHRYRDERMVRSATRIVRGYCKGTSVGGKEGGRLQQINMRWAKEKCPNHLKQEGCYDIVRSSTGAITALNVWERGITVFGSTFMRKYRYRYASKYDKLSKVKGKHQSADETHIAKNEYEHDNEVGKSDEGDTSVGGAGGVDGEADDCRVGDIDDAAVGVCVEDHVADNCAEQDALVRADEEADEADIQVDEGDGIDEVEKDEDDLADDFILIEKSDGSGNADRGKWRRSLMFGRTKAIVVRA